MACEGTKANRGVFTARVVRHVQIRGRFHKITLEFTDDGARVFAGFKPGQFVQVDVSGIALPRKDAIPFELTDASERQVLLRRPFSFCDVTAVGEKTTADLLYCVVGPATLRMTTLSADDTVNILGPLGNGFIIPEGKRIALLVIGGMGLPPLQYLAKLLSTEHSDIEAIVFAGARTAEALPFAGQLDEISQGLGFALREFAELGIGSAVATDDGSVGRRGFVTDYVQTWLDENRQVNRDKFVIFGCGPEAMLAALAKIAERERIDCQVSTERLMACGVGLCQSCAVECKIPNSSETVYKLCCKDGPVFDAKEVIFET